MPKAPINGIELYYESHGSGPAIIFAHGRGGNHMSWWQQVARFSGEFRCITFDHRGWGQSAAPYGSPLRENFAADIIALADYLELGETFLVAQSMGGFSCLEFALARPEQTLGLVLGDTTGGVVTPGVLAELSKTDPPDGVARSLAAGFIAEAARPDLPVPADPGPQPRAGRGRRDFRLPARGRAERGRLLRLADAHAAHRRGRGRHLPARRHLRGAEDHPRLKDGGRCGHGPLRALRKGRRVQRPPSGVLRRCSRRATRGRASGLSGA